MKRLFSISQESGKSKDKDTSKLQRAESASEVSHKYEGATHSEAKVLRQKAERGDIQAQFQYGTQLYTEAKLSQQESQATQAIDWLIQASSSGQQEATRLLNKCQEDKFGVTEKNLPQIKECLEMDDVERSLRSAANQVYYNLKPENNKNGNFPMEVYQQRVRDFASKKQEKKFLESTGNKLNNKEDVRREDFVDTVTRRMRSGQIDPNEDEVEMAAFQDASPFRKITKYPGVTMHVAMDTVIEGVTTDGVNLVMTLIPWDQLQVLVLFFILSILSFKWLFSVFSLVTFYTLLVIMVICTLQMVLTKRKQKEVKAMAEMLSRYNEKVKPEEVVSMFVQNSMRPYWTFLCVLVFFLPTFFMSNKTWIPCSELTVISWALCIVTMVYVSKDTENSSFLQAAVGLTALSSFPHILEGFPKVPLIYHIIKLITGNLFSVEIAGGFSLNISLPALAYLALPVIFIQMVVRKSWVGVCRGLVPLLVTLIWWELGVLFFVNSTWFGLARGSLGWMTFFILLPVIGLVGMVVGIFHLFKSLGIVTFIKVAVTFSILSVPILLALWQDSGFTAGSLSLRGRSLKVKLAVIFIPLLLVGGLVILSGEDEESEGAYINWELYKELCSKPAWSRSNIAATQARCVEFKNMEVDWTGTLKSVTITEIENNADSFFSSLPDGISEWLKCIYGKEYELIGTKETDKESAEPDKESAVTDKENAETDEENSETGEENAETDDENAETDDENAETDEENAETDNENPEIDEENAETDKENTETDQENAETDDENTETDEENVETNEESAETQLELQVAKLRAHYGRSCHVNHYSSYTFLLEITMTIAEEDEIIIPITGDEEFQHILFRLQEGNKVHFQATILDHAGSIRPDLALTHIECMNCDEDFAKHKPKKGGYFARLFSSALVQTLDFFTSPLLHYSTNS